MIIKLLLLIIFHKGTQNVIAACQKNGVKRLIYCSSAEVATGIRNIYDGTEENTEIETDQLFKPYGPTKIEAERLVLEANCKYFTFIYLFFSFQAPFWVIPFIIPVIGRTKVGDPSLVHSTMITYLPSRNGFGKNI